VLLAFAGIVAAALWAATTVVIRATRLSGASATKTLFYQLGVSALVLPLASVLLGERGIGAVTPVVAAQSRSAARSRPPRSVSPPESSW
jgi:drug/metabolite transporter (DMT)-like permease